MANGDLPDQDRMRCAFVALIGAPNAGKSTLLNALVGAKVSIVSHKVQTTRMLVRGIAIEQDAQLIFVDTPGIFEPKRRLDRAMVTSAWTGAHDADLVGLLIDARKGIDDEAAAILGRLEEVRKETFLILNKIDLVEKPPLLALAQEANTRGKFAATFMISALDGSGVADLRSWLAAHAPKGPWHYPPDEISDETPTLISGGPRLPCVTDHQAWSASRDIDRVMPRLRRVCVYFEYMRPRGRTRLSGSVGVFPPRPGKAHRSRRTCHATIEMLRGREPVLLHWDLPPKLRGTPVPLSRSLCVSRLAWRAPSDIPRY